VTLGSASWKLATSEKPSLYIEMQIGEVAVAAFWTRSVVVVIFSLLTLWQAIQFARVRSVACMPIGAKASLIATAAVVCACDPLDLVTCYSKELDFQWYALRLVGAKLLLWYPPRLVGEVLSDLYKQVTPGSLHLQRYHVSDSRNFRIFIKGCEYFYLAFLIINAIVLSCVVQSVPQDGRFVKLGESWAAALSYTNDLPALVFGVSRYDLLLGWFVIRLGELIITLKRFPYSACRHHSIIASWLLMTCLVFQILAVPAVFNALDKMEHSARDPWYSLNQELLQLFLPGGVNLSLDYLICSCALVAIFVICFGAYNAEEPVSGQTLVSMARVALPDSEALPGIRGSMLETTASRACGSIPVYEPQISFGPSKHDEPQISFGPRRVAHVPSFGTMPSFGTILEDSAGSDMPSIAADGTGSRPMGHVASSASVASPASARSPRKRTLTAQSNESDTFACGSMCSEMWEDEDDTAVTLSTVRVMAHCCSVAYHDDITEELLQTPFDSAYESDLKLKSLKQQCVINHDESDIHALVATAHLGIAQEDKVAIIAFRGTGSVQNVCTDLKLLLAPVKAPYIAALAQESHIDNVKVHAGFQDALMAIHTELIEIVTELNCSTIWITGHSLGGALATLVAVELHLAMAQRSHGQMSVALCTFGSPRVGNYAFTQLVQVSACSSVRVVADTDPVPSFLAAFRACLHYEHTSGLVRVFQNGHLIVRPSFLEEMLPWLIQHTFLPRVACWCCCFCRRGATEHVLPNYIRALHAAQQLEGCLEGDGDQSYEMTTSFVKRPSQFQPPIPQFLELQESRVNRSARVAMSVPLTTFSDTLSSSVATPEDRARIASDDWENAMQMHAASLPSLEPFGCL